ncbi:MAG: NAD(P)-dependent oxidoreductase [Pseudomonadota bacterium]
MKILVTGSAGHLGAALMRTLAGGPHQAVGCDVRPSPFTTLVGSIAERGFVARCMDGVDAVLHTATLHKPHIATHSRQDFIETNITGTLNLLEEAVSARVGAFVFTSTTSAYGHALTPAAGEPAAWITEAVTPRPKNIYGVTKLAAENLCELFHALHGLPCLVLRTSRFFPADDASQRMRPGYFGPNDRVNELLNRRVDLDDAVDAHLRALERAPVLGFGRYIVSATTPFTEADLLALRGDAAAVVARHVPAFVAEYRRRGWAMQDGFDRVYVNARARADLEWQPRHDFATAIERLRQGGDA